VTDAPTLETEYCEACHDTGFVLQRVRGRGSLALEIVECCWPTCDAWCGSDPISLALNALPGFNEVTRHPITKHIMSISRRDL
jgi:hypothetical protein